MKYLSILTLSALFILTACSTTNTNNSTEATNVSTSSYDPCKLLTSADVQALFPNGTITLDQHDTEANPVGMKICFYSTSDDDQGFAQLAVTNAADAPDTMVDGGSLRPLYENELAFLESADIQEVSNLGDAAYYGGSGLKMGAGLHLLDDAHGVKLDITVGLGFGNDDQSSHLDIEKKIAKTALSRL